jgi:hypothetical protein
MFVHARRRKVALTVISGVLIVPTNLPASESGTKSVPRAVLFAKSALQNERFGLFQAEDFRITTGRCNDCPTPKQALWYFQDESIAVPKRGDFLAGLATNAPGYQNTLRGVEELDHYRRELPYPSLIWIGSPEIIGDAILADGGKTLRKDNGEEIAFSLVPKIPTNRSYYNDSSARFFQQRSLRVRGATYNQTGSDVFVARTIWPEDFRIDAVAKEQPLLRNEKMSDLIAAQNGGAAGRFQSRLLWERNAVERRHWAGMPVLGLVLSGGQGDDDESQAGHLAVITGRVGRNGEIADWMANNFYNLDEVSEKGIIASMLPLDNYLMDLNSGQSYYRPTYLLVAVLKDARAASRFQAAIEPLYNHFYRHDFQYHHSKANCTGISIDTLRAIGWKVPRNGATSYLKAAAAFAYLSATDLSLASGKKMFDYLTEEQTRLFPRTAFEAASEDLLAILKGQRNDTNRTLTDYEQALRDDTLAVLFIRVPQIPSSRAFGTYPVASFDEYRNRVPADHSKWKIVPVDARLFPENLKEPLPAESRATAPRAILLVVFALVAIFGLSTLRNRSGGRKLLFNYRSFSKNRYPKN